MMCRTRSNKHVSHIKKCEEVHEERTAERKKMLDTVNIVEKAKDEYEGSKNQAVEYYEKCVALKAEKAKLTGDTGDDTEYEIDQCNSLGSFIDDSDTSHASDDSDS